MLLFLLSVRAMRKVTPLKTKLEMVDRMARAYGYEIGMGAMITDKVKVHSDNPFVHSDWRKRIIKPKLSDFSHVGDDWTDGVRRRFS